MILPRWPGRRGRAGAAGLGLAGLLAGAGLSQEVDPAVPAAPVALTVRESGLVIEGDLLGYDGAFYRIETEAGLVTVDGARVDCRGACPDPGLARLAASGEAEAADVLMPALVRAYAASEGLGVRAAEGGLVLSDGGRDVLAVSLTGNGTEEGFADLLAGEADMVLARRPVRLLEAALARDAGLGDLADPMRSLVLAPDALAAVVSPDGPARALSLPQLAAIFAGALGDWAELGAGGGGPVRLHLPDEASASAQGFEDAVMEPAGLPVAPAGIVRHADEADLAAAVAADPGAIGIVRAGLAGPARPLELGGGCGPAAAPSSFAVASGDYPLSLPLVLYLPARRLPDAARGFAVWLASPEAEAAARGAGFGVTADAVPFRAQADRLAAGIAAADAAVLPDLREAAAALEGHARLPETFRFEEGTARLDAAGESAARRLAARLAAGEFDGRGLLFAGFSDAAGEADARLSRLRAGVLRDHVVDLAGGTAGATLRAAGFGAALPVACPDTVWGRNANRRVELWIEEGGPPGRARGG